MKVLQIFRSGTLRSRSVLVDLVAGRAAAFVDRVHCRERTSGLAEDLCYQTSMDAGVQYRRTRMGMVTQAEVVPQQLDFPASACSYAAAPKKRLPVHY